MKIGSLVECVDDSGKEKYPEIKFPTNGKFYFVRDIIDKAGKNGNEIALLLEEIINKKTTTLRNKKLEFSEPGFLSKRFREVETNIEEIEELLYETILK